MTGLALSSYWACNTQVQFLASPGKVGCGLLEEQRPPREEAGAGVGASS